MLRRSRREPPDHAVEVAEPLRDPVQNRSGGLTGVLDTHDVSFASEEELADDITFRNILAGVIVFFLPFATYFRVRSQKTGEKLDRWQEGPFILFGLRLSALPGFVGGIAWLIDPRWMAWSSIPIPDWSRWIGLAIVSCGGALLAWTFYTLGPNLTDTVVTRREHYLVTTGPYRYVRHPFYVAVVTGLSGGSLVTANWFIFVTAVLPLAFLVARTRIEEQKLLERFGHEYEDYMRRVGRFVPRLRSSR